MKPFRSAEELQAEIDFRLWHKGVRRCLDHCGRCDACREYKMRANKTLAGFCAGMSGKLSESALERSERLEQLRFLENGIDIYVAETPHDTIGVDTEEDLKRVEGIIKTRA